MSALQLITTESRTDDPRATVRPPTACAQMTFRQTDRRRLQNLIDEWNAVVVDPRGADDRRSDRPIADDRVVSGE